MKKIIFASILGLSLTCALHSQPLGYSTRTSFKNEVHFISSTIWTPPAGVTRVFAKVWGPGGGSGGVSATELENFFGAGGGGGGYSEGFLDVTPGVPCAVNVGSGGVSGTASGGDGGNGGTSSFVGATATISATGGLGGQGSTDSVAYPLGGAGGVGQGGTLNVTGQSGQGAQVTRLNGIGGFGALGGAGGDISYSLVLSAVSGTVGYLPGGGASGAYAISGITLEKAEGAQGASGSVVITY